MLQIDLKPCNLGKNVLEVQNLQKKIKKSRSKSCHKNKKHFKTINNLTINALPIEGGSLNRVSKIREMQHIVKENKILLKKLYEANSYYTKEDFDKQNR